MDNLALADLAKPCPECTSEKRVFSLKIIPTNRDDSFWPKYIPQIRESCGDCGRYIKFASQTIELIDKLNKLLEGVKLL